MVLRTISPTVTALTATPVMAASNAFGPDSGFHGATSQLKLLVRAINKPPSGT